MRFLVVMFALSLLPVTWAQRDESLVAPIVEKLADEFEGKLKVGKVDIDQAPKLAAKYGVTSVPTVMVFEAGEKKSSMIGVAKRDKLVALAGL